MGAQSYKKPGPKFSYAGQQIDLNRDSFAAERISDILQATSTGAKKEHYEKIQRH